MRPPRRIADARSLVDSARTLDCIHCGLCLTVCPTYVLSGAEPASPRGRVHMMRALGEGRLQPDASFRAEIDACLLCGHCESACPAGARVMEMVEHTRSELCARGAGGLLSRALRRLGFRVLLTNRLLLRSAGSLLRLAQISGLERLGALLLGARGRMLRHLPRLRPLPERRLLPAVHPARARSRGRVLLLEGCVMPELFPQVNRATVRVLTALGLRCEIPSELVCCGSLHAHNGEREAARSLARRAIEIREEAMREDRRPLPVVTNSPGCTSHMKRYHHLFDEADPWHARARAFADSVVDFCEICARLLEEDSDLRLRAPLGLGSVTWDDPCHLLHAQGVGDEPRRLLDRIEGLDRVELREADTCCGSAGLYSFFHPRTSQGIFARKHAALTESGARTLITANPGCHLQWESGMRAAGAEARVLHLAELLAASLPSELR